VRSAMSKPSMTLEIVTPERLIFSGVVDSVVAPGISGLLGIYPYHCPLLTILRAGELKINKDSDEIYVAIGGGFMEVRKDKIIILADIAERDDEISEQKAKDAKKRVEKTLSQSDITPMDKDEMMASLRMETIRLNIVEKRKRRRSTASAFHDIDKADESNSVSKRKT
jgi:F-type H+-transporting ATPase subunit epsilon